jgi:hypothetical protein
MSVSRRLFLGHLFAACAAPAIVRAASIMPVHAVVELDLDSILVARNPYWQQGFADELAAITRKAFLPRLSVQILQNTPLMR